MMPAPPALFELLGHNVLILCALTFQQALDDPLHPSARTVNIALPGGIID